MAPFAGPIGALKRARCSHRVKSWLDGRFVTILQVTDATLRSVIPHTHDVPMIRPAAFRRWTLPLALAALAGAVTVNLLRAEPQPEAPGVWAIDLVRTRPGMQAEYLRGVRANWAGARRIALTSGAIRSYRALAAAPDTIRGWDVLLMTEYSDLASYAARESTFARIFASPTFVSQRLTMARPNDDLRSFAHTDVRMSAVAP